MIPINPEWDNLVLDTLADARLAGVDTWSTEWMGSEGGGSAHEVRTWIAGFAVVTAESEVRR
ncbi:hypothetical protein ABZ490_44105 [Streptomyces sp. NPDC005811]|uniref:hypothetical protein n=1 Tax=Streptomyces sp. NPDC005811 TaxID=3154565 RepID=UPI0033F02350